MLTIAAGGGEKKGRDLFRTWGNNSLLFRKLTPPYHQRTTSK